MGKAAFIIDKYNPRDDRIAGEIMELSKLCSESDCISFEILHRGQKYSLSDYLEKYRRKVPSELLIYYNIKSFTGIYPDKRPIYGNYHTVHITLG
ncbi:MAG: hypothetical protein AB8G11_00485, partial [Saprospiraceae bacterium]